MKAKSRLEHLRQYRTKNHKEKGFVTGPYKKETREEAIKWVLECIPKGAYAFVWEKDINLMSYHFDLNANIDPLYFENGDYKWDLLLKYSAIPSDEHFYFVIHHIDSVSVRIQSSFFYMAKNSYIKTFDDLLDGITVVFTVDSLETVKNIEYNFWNFGFDLLL